MQRLMMGLVLGAALAVAGLVALNGTEALLGERPEAAPVAVSEPLGGETDVGVLRRQLAEARSQAQAAIARAERADAAADAAQQEVSELESALSHAAETAVAASAEDLAGEPFEPLLPEGQADARPLSEALLAVGAAVCDGGVEPAGGLFSSGDDGPPPVRARFEGGISAAVGAFPWIAALRLDGAEGDAGCAASVIDREWLLTAAHCLTPSRWSGLEARFGEAALSDAAAPPRRAAGAVCHVGFEHRFGSFANDIALVHLAEPLPADFPIARPAKPESLYQLTPGARASSVGWGGDETLRSVDLELREANGGHLYALDPTGGQAGRCVVESGGPLAVGYGGGAQVLGIASRRGGAEGGACGAEGALAVFTDVALYARWIEDVKAVCSARSDC